MTLSVSLRERDKEREQHMKEEAIQHFKAFMADMVSKICGLLNKARLVVNYHNTKTCVAEVFPLL